MVQFALGKRISSIRDTVKRSQRAPWIFACSVAIVLAVVLGIPLGWSLRGKELSGEILTYFKGRMLQASITLVSVDASSGTVVLDWYIYNDTCILYNLKSNTTTSDQNCPPVNVYLDTSNTDTASNNPPKSPIFFYNATMAAQDRYFASEPTFRTELNMITRQNTLAASIVNYPFDKYAVFPLVYGITNHTDKMVGVFIGELTGVAVVGRGFQAHTDRNWTWSDISGRTQIYLKISRSTVVKVYAVIIVMVIWLITLCLLGIMVKGVIMGQGQRVEILVIPVSALFAFTSLRSTMPGAPGSFGAIIDFVGILPSLVFLALTSLLCLIPFILDTDPEKPRTHHNKDAEKALDSVIHPGLKPLHAGHGHYHSDLSLSGSTTAIDDSPVPDSSIKPNSGQLDHERTNSFRANWTSSHRTLDEAPLAHQNASHGTIPPPPGAPHAIYTTHSTASSVSSIASLSKVPNSRAERHVASEDAPPPTPRAPVRESSFSESAPLLSEEHAQISDAEQVLERNSLPGLVRSMAVEPTSDDIRDVYRAPSMIALPI
ncbi:uncharacterized protein STEHIDRAFT_142556 [Stereum hirsutum FP-91666 SS1]|uniref:uncharacterized protein n=1 Tax=Stereum hirsutum (strain FP-91666) TaxID=721885 RepID=UPI000444A7DE|nr:uncharacterized protein STEHIDRAFT_142556 [Stereum hirsutum FP-91666 SS1]EIM80600.1 hypothetical protein STEHIDRAFT_142556 [Stereum hirsutum FP-91666 SS1]